MSQKLFLLILHYKSSMIKYHAYLYILSVIFQISFKRGNLRNKYFDISSIRFASGVYKQIVLLFLKLYVFNLKI